MPPRKPTPEKHCRYCGTKMERKEFNGRLEDLSAFVRRCYCNRACMAAAMIKENPTDAALQVRAKVFRGPVCAVCGTTERLQIHHLNGEISDNSQPNLMTLCISCHTKWHWQNGKTSSKRQSDCIVCGQPARKQDMCQKHYQRFKKYGSPYLTKRQFGRSWQLVEDRG